MSSVVSSGLVQFHTERMVHSSVVSFAVRFHTDNHSQLRCEFRSAVIHMLAAGSAHLCIMTTY